VYQAPFDASAETLFPTDESFTQLITEGKFPNDPTFTAKLFGAGGLLQDSFVTNYAGSGYRSDMVKNTLAGVDGSTPIAWKPQHPVALCGGAGDPTVFWQVNAPVAQTLFAGQGVTVPAWNLEDRASLPAGPGGDLIYGGFQQAKAAAGSNATAQYHGSLVPPFCNALARSFFSAL
jgi:hypothetical protein